MKSDEILICCAIAVTLRRIKVLSSFINWFDFYITDQKPLIRSLRYDPTHHRIVSLSQARCEDGDKLRRRTRFEPSSRSVLQYKMVIVCVCEREIYIERESKNERRRQADEEDEVRTLIKVSTAVQDAIVCVCV